MLWQVTHWHEARGARNSLYHHCALKIPLICAEAKYEGSGFYSTILRTVIVNYRWLEWVRVGFEIEPWFHGL